MESRLVEIPQTMKLVHTDESFDDYVGRMEAEAEAKKAAGTPLTEFEELTLKMKDEPERRRRAMDLTSLLLGKLPIKSKRKLEPTQNAIINVGAVTAVARSEEDGGVNVIHLALGGLADKEHGRVITKMPIDELKALLGVN